MNHKLIFLLLGSIASFNAFASDRLHKCFNEKGEYISFNFTSQRLSFTRNSFKSSDLQFKSKNGNSRTYTSNTFQAYLILSANELWVGKINLTDKSTKKTYSFSKSCISVEDEVREAKLINTTIVSDKKSRYRVFNEVNKLALLKLKIKNSPLDFRYDVLYYIPERIKNLENVETLVFLHGGGQGTTTRSTSLGSIEIYVDRLMKLARSLGVALVIPSATGLNWGEHTSTYLKEVNRLIRSDIPLYKNKIGLLGHSMGAMAITRELPWLTDEYSFFISMAGGAESKSTSKDMLRTYLNTSYTHIQGENDAFNVFVPRSIKQKNLVKGLGIELNEEIDFNLVMHKGGHDFDDYDFDSFSKVTLDLFEQKELNYYKKNIYGLLKGKEGVFIDSYSNGNHYYLKKEDTVFWIKAMSFSNNDNKISLKASIELQNINILMDDGVKDLRVYLDDKMLNVSKDVRVTINDKVFESIRPICEKSGSDIYKCFVNIIL